MRVAVTGGAGYVGSFTVRRLLTMGHDVAVLDNLASGHREAIPNVRLSVVDVRDGLAVRRIFAHFRPEAVIHLAALKSGAESFTERATYFGVNLVGTREVLEAAVGTGVERFVFSSSCAVYGASPVCPIRERTPVAPANPYAETKYLGERAVESYGRVSGMRYAILRYFNAAGASADASLGEYTTSASPPLIPQVVRAALGRSPDLLIHGADFPTRDGTALRDYVHVEDLAEAHVGVVERLSEDACGIVNLGRGEPASVMQIVDAVRRLSGRDFAVTIGRRRLGDPAVSWADVQLAASRFGWVARRSLAEITETAWNWHRLNPVTLA